MLRDMKKLFIFSILFVSIAACSKKSGEKDYDAPVISLSSPAGNQVFPAAQTINIQGTVTDNQYINQVHIEITNLITAAEYLHVHIHPAAKTYTYNQAFSLQAGTSYKIKVIAEDRSANISSEQLEVSCN